MPSKKFKIDISNDLLKRLEKEQISYKAQLIYASYNSNDLNVCISLIIDYICITN